MLATRPPVWRPWVGTRKPDFTPRREAHRGWTRRRCPASWQTTPAAWERYSSVGPGIRRRSEESPGAAAISSEDAGNAGRSRGICRKCRRPGRRLHPWRSLAMRWHDGRAPCPVSGPEAPRCGVEPPTVTAVADARAAQKRLLGACPGFPAVSGGVCTTRIGGRRGVMGLECRAIHLHRPHRVVAGKRGGPGHGRGGTRLTRAPRILA